MLTLLEVVWWVVLFPVLCTFAVNIYWRRKLQPTKGAPPYASIAGFIFGGWYGYVVAFCFFTGGNLLLLFHLPKTAFGMQRLVGAEFVCSVVGLTTALGGRSLAKKITRSRANG